MKLIHLNQDRYFSFDMDENTGKFYLAIPLTKTFIDYLEYYEVPAEMVDKYPSNIKEVEDFVYQCRMGKMFHLSPIGRPNLGSRGQPIWPKGDDH
jgi:hypothetical protein